jgi:hypothetical protein
MERRITRREALRLGTNAAVSAAVTPLLAPGLAGPGSEAKMAPTGAGSRTTMFSDASGDVCFLRAVDLMDMIRQKKISAREVMTAHLKQIARVNPKVNAVVTQVPEDQLMAEARAADEALAQGKWLGPLHGLPIAVKDLHETKGIRTTFGSPLFRVHVPDFVCLVVLRE